jgi:putative ABC transport system permease protein
VLAAAQVTLSISLLAGAGLLIESVNRMSSVSLGFRTSHVFSVFVSLPKWNYPDDAHRRRFYRKALDRVPGAAFVNSLPMNGGRFSTQTLVVQGRPEPAPGAPRDTAEIIVSSEYFQVMGVPLKVGSLPACPECKEQVAVINEALARKYFPTEDPVGKHIRLADKKWLTITGVVGNGKDRNFFREMSWEEIPFVYRPLEQKPAGSANLMVRGAAVAPVLTALRSIDPGVPVTDAEPLADRVSKVLAYPRFRAVVLGGFAALALLLAGVGLYGVLAQSTAQRTHEFGIRFALGAERRDVLRLVVRQGMLLTGVGLALGLIVAFAVTRLLGSLLYGIRATDPVIWCGVSVVLGLVALLAMWLPARRASRVDPTEALRYE